MNSYPATMLRKQHVAQTVILAVYIIFVGLIINAHELWGDELHSWNIAKASDSFSDLITNTRYEGHPPLWYTLMWLLSKCTHNLVYLQYLQFIIICAAVYLLLFHSSLPVAAKALLPFGYYFLYEYGAFSRNYAVALLLAFSICILLTRKHTKTTWLYYLLLFLLSNTHLLGALLAGSLHLCYMLMRRGNKKTIMLHLCAGVIVFLPALFCIFPPSDSELSMSFWMSHWNSDHLSYIAAAPAKAFFPVPDWHHHHFWNSNILADNKSPAATGSVSLLLSGIAVFIIRRDKKALTLFLVNLLLTCVIAFIFPLTSARYVGFIFIAFIIACWLHTAEKPLQPMEMLMLRLLLLLQICGSIIAVPRDLTQPFSNAYKVNEVLEKIPKGEKTVTDYWCLNNVAAYADKPFYCIELRENTRFLRWDDAFARITAMREIYTESFNYYFQNNHEDHVLLLSSNAPAAINKRDTTVSAHYDFKLADSCTGAIEKHSDLYLYVVRPLSRHN